jgi:hypothetical protein
MKKFSLLALVILFIGCNESSQNMQKDFSRGSGGLLNAETYATDEMEMAPEEIAFNKNRNVSPSSEIQEQKIIKTANLDFETQELEKTHQTILNLTAQYKGIVQSDNSGKSYDRIYRNVTLRVPSENFQLVVDGISDGVAFFDQRVITRQDVTEEFVDIQARLRAKKELENRYLDLLKQAKNVKEMLEIERELSQIREEIEAKEGRLKFLESRVSMSTINISFYKTTVETGVRVSYGAKMGNSLKGGWEGVSIFFLGILYLWPLFLIAIIVILVVRRLIKRSRKKK